MYAVGLRRPEPKPFALSRGKGGEELEKKGRGGNGWEKTNEPSFEKGRRKRERERKRERGRGRVAFDFLWAPPSLRG